MPVFKAINKHYNTQDDLWNLVNYVIADNHCIDKVYGAQGIIKSQTDNMYQQMVYVKKYFRKENGRQALHYVLSFSKEEEHYIGIQEALEIGYKVANYFCGWQVVFGVHTNTGHLHLHFVVNNTSYENGKSFSIGLRELSQIQAISNNIVECYHEKSMSEEERKEHLFHRFGF